MVTLASSITHLTQLPPSCVVFHPEQNHLFVIGTYYLEQQDAPQDGRPQRRSGSVHLYQLAEHDLSIECGTPLSCPSGILDIAISPHDSSVLCAATSTGSIIFMKLDTRAEPHLVQLRELPVCNPGTLVLDLAFHPVRPDVLGVTLSSGETTLLEFRDDLRTDTSWSQVPAPTNLKVHTASLEAWTLAFSPSGRIVITGSDDASLAIAAVPETLHESPAVAVNNRIHSAGITSVLSLHEPALDDSGSTAILLTGSYDDRLVVSRHPRPPVSTVLAELNLGGGVWRTSLVVPPEQRENQRRWLVLCACMYGGARIVEVRCRDWGASLTGRNEEDGQWQMTVPAKFEEHESMCYGCDVQPVAEGGDGTQVTVVSTSFYDKRLCAWKFTVPRWD